MTEVNRDALLSDLDKLIAERNELRVLAARLDREVDARDAWVAELVEAGNAVAEKVFDHFADKKPLDRDALEAAERWREVAG